MTTKKRAMSEATKKKLSRIMKRRWKNAHGSATTVERKPSNVPAVVEIPLEAVGSYPQPHRRKHSSTTNLDGFAQFAVALWKALEERT